MFGLRQKLLFGFGGLLAMLLIVSALGVAVLAEYRTALDKFFYENWRSIEDGEHVLAAVAKLDDIVRPLGSAPSAGAVTAAAASATGPLADADANCTAEDHNITLEGESTIAGDLTLAWSGRTLDGHVVTNDCYRETIRRLLTPSLSTTDRARLAAAMPGLSDRVRKYAQAVIDLNLENMRPIDGRAKQMADRAILLMVAMALAGVGLAIVFTLLVTRSILKPLATVIGSIQEIERGNLDLVVQVRSRDELRQLAEAFNSMAAKLREFRRTNRAKLIRTQQTTQLAVNSLPDAIAVTGPEGIIELSNDAARTLFALEPGKDVTDVGDHRLVDVYREVLKSERVSQPRGYESAVELYDKGGQLRFFLPRAVPIPDADGRLIGVTLVLADVTNLRKLDEMKSGLLSVVSHELKTPLTSIRMAVHLLLEERVGSLNAKQIELLGAAREDSDRLDKIIADLLDMGRLESGKGNLEFRPERVAELIGKSVTPLEGMFRDRGVTIEIDTSAVDGVEVMIDPTRIGHVLTNLLTNAAKFTDPGGRVTVTAEPAGEAVRFIVADTGIGIPAEFQSRVFDRFFRVPGPAGATHAAGAGLGLAIVREIVRAHGGEIELNSEVGQGSRFSFTLRRAVAAETARELATRAS